VILTELSRGVPSDMMDLQALLGAGAMPKPGEDIPTMDTAETVHISSLALLKVIRR
jgi:hypothetical protein